MTRTTLKNRINKLIAGHTKGVFIDESWYPVHNIFRALQDAGYDVINTGNKYDHDANGNPCAKTWTFEIASDSKKPFYGIVIACGAGTVANPLKAYDVCAYVS